MTPSPLLGGLEKKRSTISDIEYEYQSPDRNASAKVNS